MVVTLKSLLLRVDVGMLHLTLLVGVKEGLRSNSMMQILVVKHVADVLGSIDITIPHGHLVRISSRVAAVGGTMPDTFGMEGMIVGMGMSNVQWEIGEPLPTSRTHCCCKIGRASCRERVCIGV